MNRIISILLLALPLLLRAQPPGRIYSAMHYSGATGLASNEVNATIQDMEGYMWIATNSGLQRYDGTRFKTFLHRQNDPTSISFNNVVSLAFDKRKNFWLLMGDGSVGIFDTHTFIFRQTQVKVPNPEWLKTQKKLHTDEKGNVFYVCWGRGFATWDSLHNTFSTAANFIPVPLNWDITDVVHEPGTSRYWMGLQSGGLAVYNHDTRQFSYPGHNLEKEPAIDLFAKIPAPSNPLIDSKKRLWFDTWGPAFPYVHCYDIRNRKILLTNYEFLSELKAYNEVGGFLEQKDGTIWVRGYKVLASYIEKDNRFELVRNGYESEQSIVYDIVADFCEDREENLWIATRNNGLYRFAPKEQFFSNVQHINPITKNIGDGTLMSFVTTRNGTLLTGTWGNGLFRYDMNLKPLPLNIKNIEPAPCHSVWSMTKSRDSNTIWMSAQPGIYEYNQTTNKIQFHNPPLLEDRTVRQVAEDKYGNLWLGMQHVGVFRWDREKGKKNFDAGLSRYNSVGRVMINKIYADQKTGYVWIGTSVEGLYVIDARTGNVVQHIYSKSEGQIKQIGDGISCVLPYNDSCLIISNTNSIFLYNQYSKMMLTLGGPNIMYGNITAIEIDKQGYLWVSTTNGIFRVNVNNKIFVKFDRADGILNDHFVLASSHKLPDGRIIFGSSNQFVVFDPSRMNISGSTPPVHITDFKVMNKSLRVDSLLALDKIVLRHDANSLLIEFSTLNYNEATLIKYKLEPLDKAWQVADKNNQAIYSYLPPGTYSFVALTEDTEGIRGKHVTQLIIKVRPPFWRSWWFYSLLVLLVTGILFWIDRERMKRKAAMQKMRSDIAGNLHEEVNTALNNINILSEMARLKADKEPQKSKEFIEQIHNKSHNMIIAMDDMLWSLDPDNDNMEKTILRMKEYIDALNNRHATDIEMHTDKKVCSLSLNMKLRHESFLLFKDAIASLVQAGARKCRLHLGLEKNKLLFTIQLNNEGCDLQQLTHMLQRKDMEKRVRSINATFDVQVHKSSSILELIVPIG